MLDIFKTESENEVYVSGILNELEITEGETKDGRGWIRGRASIRVDQDIKGVMSENIIPVDMFSMKKKSDGSDNMVYERILGYRDRFTSLAAAEDESEASRITISNGRLEENAWVDKTSGEIRSTFRISGNFLNKAKDGDKEKATYAVKGVIGGMRPELDRNGDETGRLIVKFIVIGWAGKVNLVDMYADGSARQFIETNWNQGDTVTVTGRINMTYKVETWLEEQGFGEPIERTRTVSKRELVITGGSPSGLDEDESFDADSVSTGLAKRKEEQEAMKIATKKSAPKKKVEDFGF